MLVHERVRRVAGEVHGGTIMGCPILVFAGSNLRRRFRREPQALIPGPLDSPQRAPRSRTFLPQARAMLVPPFLQHLGPELCGVFLEVAEACHGVDFDAVGVAGPEKCCCCSTVDGRSMGRDRASHELSHDQGGSGGGAVKAGADALGVLIPRP